MGRFERWGGWLVALVLGLSAFAGMRTLQGDVDSYREVADDLKVRIMEQTKQFNASARELAEARTQLAEATERIAAQKGSPSTTDESRVASARFIGHWRLVSFENFAEDGTVTQREMTGRIMYDADGNMSAQLMPQGDSVEVDGRYTQGYIAYFGAYEVDRELGTVTHRPEGSAIFPWVGGELVRYYSFSDGNLMLSLKEGERVTGTLTWERIE